MEARIESLLAGVRATPDAERDMVTALSTESGARHRDELLLAVGRSTGTLLQPSGQGPASALDPGARDFIRLLAVWLAEAAKETGGKVITTDLVAEKSAYAKSKLENVWAWRATSTSGLATCCRSCASSLAPSTSCCSDVWKDIYVQCFDLFQSNSVSAPLWWPTT